MLKIRINKSLKKKFFKIIVIDSKKPRDGKYIEKIGFYSPLTKINYINIKKINYWLLKGAKLTKTVKYILNEFIKYNQKRKK